jgi:3-methyl-2-oxobutanoate hydroxymethyltransferase
MLGIYEDIRPKFVKRYVELSKSIFDAVASYSREIKTGKFPEESNTFHLGAEELDKFMKMKKK